MSVACQQVGSTMRLCLYSFILYIFCGVSAAQAQQIVGRCASNKYMQSFVMYPDGLMVMEQNPLNRGFAVRDPSGLNFLRLPAANPYINAYFAAWDGRLIEITANVGVEVIGYCEFASGLVPPAPIQYSPPQMASWGVRIGNTVQPLPKQLANTAQRYVEPMLASPEMAESCFNESSGEEEEFADCMIKGMTGPREQAVYECSKNSEDKVGFAFCSIGALGGDNEKRASSQLEECYAKYQDDLDQYPLCMAQQNANTDTQRLINCVQKQAQNGEISIMGTAVCYGADSLDLNPELQIAVECAATTGGDPMTFAGCAGGRLTERELRKCLTEGIGGDGCFGPNNDIVKALNSVGLDLGTRFGPNNDLVRNWNNAIGDIQNGPGPGNDAVKVITNIANDIANGPGENNDIVKAVDSILSGFSIEVPSLP